MKQEKQIYTDAEIVRAIKTYKELRYRLDTALHRGVIDAKKFYRDLIEIHLPKYQREVPARVRQHLDICVEDWERNAKRNLKRINQNKKRLSSKLSQA